MKHINKYQNNRIEYLFVNFDYFDGNELVANLFCQEYQMSMGEKIDGRIYYSIIKLNKDSIEYNLIWHEDVGNYIFLILLPTPKAKTRSFLQDSHDYKAK